MRKKLVFRLLFICCAVLSAFILTVSTAFGASYKEDYDGLPGTSSIIRQVYIVGEYDGYIAVFREGESLPFETTGVRADRFSEYDRSQLKTGIIARSDSELQTILEGYDVY